MSLPESENARRIVAVRVLEGNGCLSDDRMADGGLVFAIPKIRVSRAACFRIGLEVRVLAKPTRDRYYTTSTSEKNLYEA